MAKCCVIIDKIKSMGTLKSRWSHDINEQFRKEHVLNADESLYGENDVLVACVDEEGEELSYDQAVKNRIKGLKQIDGRKIRNNAVLAYDIVLEFGDSDDIIKEGIDVDEWEKRSLEWLKETFNVAGDGKDNVISAVCHKDEKSPHIHAIVTPVDDRSSLCARSFTNGSSALSRFQDEYAAKLEDLGIERGVKGSSAYHKSNKKYNAEKKKAIKEVVPEPKDGQTAFEFYQEFQENLEQWVTDEKEKMDKERRNIRARDDKERQLARSAINKEVDDLKLHYESLEFEYKEQIAELKDELSKLNELSQSIKDEIEDMEELKNAKTQMDAFMDKIEMIQSTEEGKKALEKMKSSFETIYEQCQCSYIEIDWIDESEL